MDGGHDIAGDQSPTSAVVAGARAIVRTLADVAMPPQCLACHALAASAGSLCPSCWSRLTLIEKPYCARLGIPFAYDLGDGALSAEAIADPPPFDRCRAVAAYDDVARHLVHGLKYRDRQELAQWMAGWMIRAGGELIAEADVVVPVPLHRRRLWSRRFNQSVLLARTLGERSGKPLVPFAVKRVRPTAHQVGLTPKEREANVRGAFVVPAAEKIAVAGRRVLVVDDVYTTGATARAVTRALLRAGAVGVDILVFARVVRERM